jgi:sigma-B regulation protein RsbQ
VVSVRRRNNVHEFGDPDGPPLVFAHGFGCSQDMWRFVAPAFVDDHRVILFDHVGAGGSDASAYDEDRHATLRGYAEDVVELLEELAVREATFVGHSVSSMIGVLAQIAAPELIDQLVLLCPSPRYLDDEGYRGGFGRADMEELLDLVDRNYLGWAAAMAPTIVGNPDRPALATELEDSFCRTDPEIAKRFARATFLGDNRLDLPKVSARTLVVQVADDAIASVEVGEYVAAHVPDSELTVLDVSGHCPNLSAPEETIAAIRAFVDRAVTPAR